MKVLWVKFGWSDYYRGGPVNGNFSWLTSDRGKKNGGRGHEALNFFPGSDGTYYCYVPPQSSDSAPSHPDPYGWKVICLAKNPKHKGIHVVGWYENATLHGEWLEPPPHMNPKRGDTQRPAYDWSYCITSNTTYFVPPQFRTMPFSDKSVRQGKYSFLGGPGIRSNANKKRVLALLKERLKALESVAVKNPNEANAPDPEIDASDPLNGFGTPQQRKEVEEAAERAVIAYYKAKGFTHDRLTHLPCGYDFAFHKGRTTLHVEVKGTAGKFPQFFLTRNEHAKGLMANPLWRLAMVTDALTAPKVEIYEADTLKKAFDLEPYVFLGRLIPESEG